MEGRAANWGEKYPETRRDDTTLHEHGMTDPYRWLEDPDSPETKAWVDAQNKVTFELLESCDYRTKVKERLTELYNYPKYGCPFKRGSRYFYFKNDGLQNQSVLYSQTSLEGEPEVFLDPNVLESDGTAALGSYAFSESGEYFAYGVSKSGSDWQTIHVRKVSTKEDLSEQIHWVKFSGISWTHDDRGFFYSRYPAPSQLENDDAGKRGSETNSNLYHKVYYHRLGTDQSSDVLVFETPEEPHWMSGAVVSDDGRYVTISISKSTAPVNKLYYADLSTFDPETGALDVIKLVDNFDAEYDYITNEGTLFYFKTNLKAPRNKIVSVDVSTATTREDSWKDHVAEQEDVLSYACCFDRNKLILNYIHHVKDVLHIHSLQDGSHIKELELPTIGTITSIRSRKEDSDLFFSFTSFLYPGSIFRYNDESGLTVFRETKVEGFDPEQFKTEQVFYSSKDGTKIPMFIVSKQTAQKDGNQAVYLYGYGGFNISIQPTFSVFRIVFMQHFNVTLAIPNIRGGGEYGEEWHQAGTLERKQNVFDDFCAAAEYLIENKYTKPEKCVISLSFSLLVLSMALTWHGKIG
ncbi:Prolyl endopeptidase [Balamuthia mandrillaris]